MADEKIKVKIVPQNRKYFHDIGDVEITIPEQDIKLYGFKTAYKITVKEIIQRVKNLGFVIALHSYEKAKTDFDKLDLVPILWRDNDNNLIYDARNKDLTRWFCESLEDEIKRVQTDKEDEIQADRTTQNAPQAEPEKIVNDNSPRYVSDLLEVGLIDKYFRCDSLEKVAVFIMQNRHKTGVLPYAVLRSRFLRQFKRLDGSDFSYYAISKARKAAKKILEEEE